MKNNFAYFIASYGKPVNMPTLKALQAVGAEYPIYVVVGSDDPKLDEYRENFTNNLFVFDKSIYLGKVDKIGIYANSDKICTYSRLAVDDIAKSLGIRYVGYLFDDIISFRLRYKRNNIITGTYSFPIDRMIDLYIELLSSSDKLKFTGPPSSSFYIGVNDSKVNSYSTRYGNFMIYDIDNPLLPHKASAMEDMSIVLYHNMIGQMSICPFGLQVNCRAPKVTKDSYGSMTVSEYECQRSIICNGYQIDLDRSIIPYSRFTPKIIAPVERKVHKKKLF